MAAAYAALMSLMSNLEVILHPSKQWLRINRIQIESLLQKVGSLQEFLEEYSHRDHEEMAALESRIVDTAQAAVSVIDYHVLDQLVARSKGSEAKSSTSFFEYIRSLLKEMEELIETEVMKIKETTGALEESRLLIDFSPDVSSRLAPQDQNTLVGSDKKLIEIMGTLTGQQSNREIIVIVGMGGIGKTTLAKNVYKNAYTAEYFHIRAWARVSQSYSVRKIILEMLSEIYRSKQESVPSDDKLHEQLYESRQESVISEYQLGDRLYKILFDMRYLIVMDDLWSIEAWDKIRAFLPDNRNGSRIMITTRLLNLARQLSSFRPFEMEFLDYDQSWELLCDKVFGKEGCPSELEELGMDIAKKCRGLPLAIVVTGGLLAKSNKTQKFWKYVTENLNSIINSGDDENCLKILNLSYKNLPIHLKPCFLYMALIAKHDELAIPNLYWSLAAEGFLKPIRDQSLEEVAEEYITDLIDRNLIFGDEITGNIETWGMHDLLKDLCWRKAEKENFLIDSPLNRKDFKSCLRFHEATDKFVSSGYQVVDLLRQASLMRSTTRVFASRLIVWDTMDVVEEFSPVEEEITQLSYFPRLCFLRSLKKESMWKFITQLPYFPWLPFLRSRDSESMGKFIPSISRFWCLQSLIVFSTSSNLMVLPSEIWDLLQLRHLFSNCVFLREPHSRHDDHNPHILENLQILDGVFCFSCTDEVLRRAPNLRSLRVGYGPPGLPWHCFYLHNFFYLQKLESLIFESADPTCLGYLIFPFSLKQLNLLSCLLPQGVMTMVGVLPNLEALGLVNCAFEDQEWCPVEGEFLRLKLLGIDNTDLLHWKADKTHFPILEQLILSDLNLEELPEDFGELPTLRKLKVLSCSDSTTAWAEQIREQQESFGNEDLQVTIKRKRG